MILKVYAVFDEVSRIYKHQFFRVRDGEASRFFGDACKDKQTELNAHPSDFSLFHLADFDDESGVFISLDVPRRVCRATDFVSNLLPGMEVSKEVV